MADTSVPAPDGMHASRAAGLSDAGPMLWPATLDHVALGSPDPEALAGFYVDQLDFTVTAREGGAIALAGPGRRLVIGPGTARQLLHAGFDMGDAGRVARYRAVLDRAGAHGTADIASPFFQPGAFAVSDPDGNRFAFGVARGDGAVLTGRPGRLQHVVVAATDAGRIADFMASGLGFRVTDWVRNAEGDGTACFLRSDEEHHSFAVFRAPAGRLDHFSFEVSGWDDIRDWCDHFARTGVPIFWGPGRHGPGNNLFMMANDPDGNAMEFSAEITRHPYSMPAGEWPHVPKTLNLWGAAIMRS